MITANIWFGQPWELYWMAEISRGMARRLIKPEKKVADMPPVMAEVNHGRWIVICECGGAEYAWEEGLFMCQSCWNERHGHLLRRIEFPKKREKIEKILIVRPIHNRNWKPEEPIEKLEIENETHKAELIGE